MSDWSDKALSSAIYGARDRAESRLDELEHRIRSLERTVVAWEEEVGVDDSMDTTSMQYRVRRLEEKIRYV